ncbi:hypothetical protein [Apilactobacillus micheneri]|uniref:Uncharacterized protein n=1 Tax=Apilactobacillus micheneri TaxID=1899430 RepID=A0A9Q8IMJ2_9LACO|nr:hypothetical protein [Apilactobacillus micheneri]TPR39912.1 hypothetical protein DY121_03495 [Apilactobacillus micheneri]TPR41727.1 hypothetical protein DY123_04135 [Apilactobacillus micheneri]TPR44114.1 hypothetical protein DY130_03490 [Apilactobacillus micheneri]TPR45738.1 hypothetical protein DY128_03490 [Apilactobacillus micheneri]TPR51495.1 hypothetical protein DY126_03520 [Apilactobacillus micheneri]
MDFLKLLSFFGNGIGLIFRMWKLIFFILCCIAMFNLLGGDDVDWETVGQYTLLIVIFIAFCIGIHYANKKNDK